MTGGDGLPVKMGNGHRPNVVLTRTDVLDVRTLVTATEVPTSARGLAEFLLGGAECGLQDDSVVNCDDFTPSPNRAGSVSLATSRKKGCTRPTLQSPMRLGAPVRLNAWAPPISLSKVPRQERLADDGPAGDQSNLVRQCQFGHLTIGQHVLPFHIRGTRAAPE